MENKEKLRQKCFECLNKFIKNHGYDWEVLEVSWEYKEKMMAGYSGFETSVKIKENDRDGKIEDHLWTCERCPYMLELLIANENIIDGDKNGKEK